MTLPGEIPNRQVLLSLSTSLKCGFTMRWCKSVMVTYNFLNQLFYYNHLPLPLTYLDHDVTLGFLPVNCISLSSKEELYILRGSLVLVFIMVVLILEHNTGRWGNFIIIISAIEEAISRLFYFLWHCGYILIRLFQIFHLSTF